MGCFNSQLMVNIWDLALCLVSFPINRKYLTVNGYVCYSHVCAFIPTIVFASKKVILVIYNFSALLPYVSK